MKSSNSLVPITSVFGNLIFILGYFFLKELFIINEFANAKPLAFPPKDPFPNRIKLCE